MNQEINTSYPNRLRTRPALPARYEHPWRQEFDDRLARQLRPGVRILDVGAGRKPVLPPERRPAGCLYAGLDISQTELELAPAGSYDEVWVSDVTTLQTDLAGRFDLVLSWQVLEHVKPVEAALNNLRAYLAPGGRMIALLSGTYSAFGVINAVVPQRLGVWAMHRLLQRPPDTVFPAYYDGCSHRGLANRLAPWSEAEIVPLFRGAGYFGFLPVLQRGYLAFEEWAVRGRHHNLATHYLIEAVR